MLSIGRKDDFYLTSLECNTKAIAFYQFSTHTFPEKIEIYCSKPCTCMYFVRVSIKQFEHFAKLPREGLIFVFKSPIMEAKNVRHYLS